MSLYNVIDLLEKNNFYQNTVLDRETISLVEHVITFHIDNNFSNFDRDSTFFQKLFSSNQYSYSYTLPSSDRFDLNKLSNLKISKSNNELNKQSGRGLGDLTRKITMKKTPSHNHNELNEPKNNYEAFIEYKVLNKFKQNAEFITDTQNPNNYFSKKNIIESFKNFTDLIYINNLNIADNLYVACQIYILIQIIFDHFQCILKAISVGTLDIISEKSTVTYKNVYRQFPEKNIYLKLYFSIVNTKYYCPIRDDTFLFNDLKSIVQDRVAKITTPFITKSNSGSYIINNYIQTLRLKPEDKNIESNPKSCMYYQFTSKDLSQCQSIFVLSYYESYFTNNFN